MKKSYTLLFFIVLVNFATAQQPAQYSLYNFNKFNFNPAYAGLDNSLSLTGVYRSQWGGIPGKPVTQNVNAHLPLYVFSGGVGLEFESETLGNWEQSKFLLAYNFQLPISRTGMLSLGLSAGLIQRRLDGTKIITPEGAYEPDPEHEDPILPVVSEEGNTLAVNFGAFYQDEKLEIGISAMNLTEQAIELTSLAYKPERSYFLYLGYNFDIGKSITINPSTLLKSTFQQTQMDFSVIVKYNSNIFGGASFRGYNSDSNDAIALMAGFKLSEKITLAYAYDLTLSKLNTVSNGSHEIMLNYNLGKPIGKGKPPKIIYNPRFL